MTSAPRELRLDLAGNRGGDAVRICAGGVLAGRVLTGRAHPADPGEVR